MARATGRLRHVLVAACMVFTALLLGSHALVAHAEQKFLDPDQAFGLTVAMATPTEVAVHYKIAPAYYMYQERFEFSLKPDAQRLGPPVFPKAIVKYDPNFEKDVDIYHDQVTIRVPVKAGATQDLALDITSQGCADAGLCYAPMTESFTLHPTAAGYTISGPGVVDHIAGAQGDGQVLGGGQALGDGQGAPGVAKAAAGTTAGLATGLATGMAAPGNSADTGGDVSLGKLLNIGDTGIASFLATAGWVKIIVVCLVLGLLLSFTPCVLPMVPILVTIIAGDAGRQAKVSRWRGLSLAAVYVLGMSVVYTILGVLAGLLGASLSVWLQTPWVLALFAILLALLALAMFDVYTVQTPGAMQSALNGKLSRIAGGRVGAALVMGMISALIVGPCVAAPLAGVLLFISQTQDLVLGGVALFALAWGQGLLLLLVGATSGALLPRAGAWMDGVKHVFGVLLLATAWWMVNSVVPPWLAALGWAALALWSAVMLGAFEPLSSPPRQAAIVRKALGLLLALWAALIIVGVGAGQPSVWQPLKGLRSGAAPGQLASAGLVAGQPRAPLHFKTVASVQQLDAVLAQTTRPVMLDFYADWCVSCIEMEKFTFSDPAVADKMSRFLLLRADVTKNTAADRALLKRFKLFGPPGIMFFNSAGTLLTDARVIGFKNATQFSAVLARVLARN
jgi:thiol:disulfide interchange protein DsbD